MNGLLKLALLGTLVATGVGFSQADKSGAQMPAAIHAGPVYAPEKPNHSLEVVVDFAPAADMKQTAIDTERVRQNSVLVEERKTGAVADRAIPFSASNKSMALAIVIDVSSGMGRSLESVKRGLLSIVDKKRTQDKVALVAFAGDVSVLADFSASPDVLRAAVARLRQERSDNPRLYRALDRALKLFLVQDPNFPARRRLLAVAQGKNPGPESGATDAGFQAADIVTQALGLHIPIDTIGVPGAVRSAPIFGTLSPNGDIKFGFAGSNDSMVNVENMDRLASKTGGMYLLHNPKTDLGERLNQGVQWLMNSPVLRFPVQSLAFDGKSHDVSVRVTGIEMELPAILTYADDGYRVFFKKYGLFVIGGALALLLVVLAMQGQKRPQRQRGVHTQSTPQPHTPDPASMAGPGPARPTPTLRPPGGPVDAQQIGFPGAPAQVNMPPALSGVRPPMPRPVPTVPVDPPRRQGTMVIQSSFPPPAPGQPTCYLQVLTGPQSGNRFPFESDLALIGRGPQNAISCGFDPAISDPHAQLRYQGGSVVIVDLNSSNGTYVNGQRVTPGQAVPLAMGDRLHLGQTDFQLV